MTKRSSNRRIAVTGIAVTGLAFAGWLLFGDNRLEADVGGVVRDGEAGFVVTKFAYALGADPIGTSACPAGPSKNVAEIYGATLEGQRKPGEGDKSYSDRLEAGGRAISNAPDGRNFCAFPEIAPPDPNTQRMLDPHVRVDGLNLDGLISHSAADQRTGRLDFTAPDGTQGIDNQFWRTVGCTRSYQKDGLSNGFEQGMYVGEWGILIGLSGVNDLANDDDVDVLISANADPIRLSPSRSALEFATYSLDPDLSFRATTSGRIKNGVLTTEPVDVRFHSVVNGMYLIRPLRDARIRARVSPDGKLEGLLAGFTPTVALYDYQFGFRNAKDAKGAPSDIRRRLGSSNGAARVLGHTCQGIWQSLHALADGHPDNRGRFTSISTQYRFEARPAFLVEPDRRAREAASTAARDD